MLRMCISVTNGTVSSTLLAWSNWKMWFVDSMLGVSSTDCACNSLTSILLCQLQLQSRTTRTLLKVCWIPLLSMLYHALKSSESQLYLPHLSHHFNMVVPFFPGLFKRSNRKRRQHVALVTSSCNTYSLGMRKQQMLSLGGGYVRYPYFRMPGTIFNKYNRARVTPSILHWSGLLGTTLRSKDQQLHRSVHLVVGGWLTAYEEIPCSRKYLKDFKYLRVPIGTGISQLSHKLRITLRASYGH